MDLKELDNTISRHPWETARLKAISSILRPHLFDGIKVLDVGCGDGFISRELFSHLHSKEITAVDIHLSAEQLLKFNNSSGGILYFREFPENRIFDLVLLLDVLEHVEEDVSFLSNVVKRYLSKGKKILLTVPAFQSIFGSHDVNLGHYRRYSLKEIEAIAGSSGLKIISSGYLFSSLLLPKYILCTVLKIDRYTGGVGHWDGGRLVSGIWESLLNLDNSLLISLSRFGIRIPGLTGWVLCEKQE
jgi:SAM-dependent methyltransferase